LVAKGSVRHGGAKLIVRITATVQGDEFQGTATVTRCYQYVVHLTIVTPAPEEVDCPNTAPITFTTAPPTTLPE
jgi:hypothetical protein